MLSYFFGVFNPLWIAFWVPMMMYAEASQKDPSHRLAAAIVSLVVFAALLYAALWIAHQTITTRRQFKTIEWWE